MNFCSHYYPAPPEFWCFETGEPFRKCSLCGTDLWAEGTNYLVEKAFKKSETIFEYAMCFHCYTGIQNSLSKKSRKLVAHYFAEHIDIEERRKLMISKYGRRTKSWISRCMIKGTPISKCDEHQIYGWFIDKDITFAGLPYMLSGAAIDEIIELLSDETLGIMDEMSGKLFGIDQPQSFLLI